MPTPCPTKIDCQPCNDFPIINVSAETPDVDRFISRFSFLSVPPIRQYPDFDMEPGAAGIFLQVGCMRWCWSTISQADADACAALQAVECAFDPLVPDVPPPPSPFIPHRIALYFNLATTGTFTCPDGNIFSYTLPANQIAALTQGQANQIAASLANARARQHRLCLSNLDDPICEGSFYTNRIVATGPYVAVFPAQDHWELLSGTLPPGMTLETGFSSNGIVFSGVATTIGSYSFTVRCTLNKFGSPGFGDFMVKTFTVRVVGISESTPLPQAILGIPYSEQLTAAFSDDHEHEIWTILSGNLPDGLSFSPAGLISGTATGAEAGYSFLVQIQYLVHGKFVFCTKQLMIETMNPVDLGDVTPDILSSAVSFYSGGGPLVAGTYRVQYVNGAMEYANCMPTQCWSVNTIGAGFHVVYNGGTADVLFPASTNTFPNQAGAEAENTGKIIDIVHTGGTIGVFLNDTNYGDNQPGAPNPTFKLLRIS